MRSDSDNYRHLFLNDIPMIDTRAPVEFLRGAFEHAVNLPLMTDSERHQVGIRYKEAGQDAAIELGRKLVGPELQEERTDQWLDFANRHPDGYLYCFRGGLRSRITQNWMAERGVRYPYVMGGYKAMRRFLLAELERLGSEMPLVLVYGRTGTGKTRLLNRIRRSLDLEKMANHRGSSFGPMVETQPTPIDFENRLSVGLLKLAAQDESSPIHVEGEGRMIGSLSVPEQFWRNMQGSPVMVLEADMDSRVEMVLSDYVIELLEQIRSRESSDSAFESYAARHRDSLHRIRRRLGPESYGEALAMLEAAFSAHRDHGDREGYRPFIRLLLERYYDPMYDYQLSRRKGKVLARGYEAELVDWLHSRGVETT